MTHTEYHVSIRMIDWNEPQKLILLKDEYFSMILELKKDTYVRYYKEEAPNNHEGEYTEAELEEAIHNFNTTDNYEVFSDIEHTNYIGYIAIQTVNKYYDANPWVAKDTPQLLKDRQKSIQQNIFDLKQMLHKD